MPLIYKVQVSESGYDLDTFVNGKWHCRKPEIKFFINKDQNMYNYRRLDTALDSKTAN